MVACDPLGEYIYMCLPFYFAQGELSMSHVDKPFMQTQDQLNILKERNLNIITEESAKNSLRNYGYYEIINGYKQRFMIDPNDDKAGFKPGSNFEHIFALYTLDNEIRNAIRDSLEAFEQTFKQALAYVIARDISEDQRRYTAKTHYDAGKSHRYRKHGHMVVSTERDYLLRKFNSILNSNFEPFKYYRENHDNIPPWILVKGLTFGKAIYWYSLSQKSIREGVIGRLIDLDPSIVRAVDDNLQIKRAIGDTLNLFLDYRNLSSHVGRVYNHRSERHQIRNYSSFIYQNNVIAPISKSAFSKGYLRSSIGIVLRALNMFKNKDPFVKLDASLYFYISKYLKNYPEDSDFLLDVMELRDTYVERRLLTN